MKKTLKVMAVVVALCMAMSLLTACAKQPDAVMTLEGKSLSVNTYQLLLTRMKGTVAGYGYNVNNPNFWRTIISVDGTTYEDYFTVSVQEQASRYLIADYLFDYYSLELTDEDLAPVDALMEAYVKHAGSKNNLNATLKNYSANYDILRELLVLDVKTNAVKEHIFGDRCENVDVAVKEAFLQDNYIAFAQIFVPTHSYVVKLDEFKDTVYFTDESYSAIAYDTKIGLPEMNEFGEVVLDEFNNVRYFDENGKVAYDKVNGVVGYETEKDKDGNVVKKTRKMSTAEIEELAKKVNVYLEACDGDMDAFYEHVEIYGEGERDGEKMYLNTSGTYYLANKDYSYLDTIAQSVKDSEKIGDCSVVQSNDGFHIVCKLEVEPGIYDNEAQKDVFADFYTKLSAKLFDEECKKYESLIKIDNEVLANAPKISEVETNTLY